MKYKDKISVIIPTYNRGRLILKSIESLLNQTYDNIEIIVVDDGSTDNTEQIVKNINNDKVKYFKTKKNKGACAARNLGIKKSTGKYITFNDSDDTYTNDKLEKQYQNLIKNNSDMDFCKINIHIENKTLIVPEEKREKNILKGNYIDELMNGNYISTQAIFVKRNVILKYMFDEDMPRLQDYDLVIRMVPNIKLSYTNEILCDLVRQDDSISNSNEKLLETLKLMNNKEYNISKENKEKLNLFIMNCYANATNEANNVEYLKVIDDLKKQNEELSTKINELNNSYNELNNLYNLVVNSKTWKLRNSICKIIGRK